MYFSNCTSQRSTCCYRFSQSITLCLYIYIIHRYLYAMFTEKPNRVGDMIYMYMNEYIYVWKCYGCAEYINNIPSSLAVSLLNHYCGWLSWVPLYICTLIFVGCFRWHIFGYLTLKSILCTNDYIEFIFG